MRILVTGASGFIGAGPVAAVVRSARTSNAKLRRALGWEPAYPDSREGIPLAASALAAAG